MGAIPKRCMIANAMHHRMIHDHGDPVETRYLLLLFSCGQIQIFKCLVPITNLPTDLLSARGSWDVFPAPKGSFRHGRPGPLWLAWHT